ncbi:VanW family protein [Curtanaerobium respiraculi]|uniref:VanW family protein n=1 Tax=Curtanaerobium respiraculi TaxID=2949669 RepID=UPI0024B3BE37|nr:VanW family protein [Curtanaerobium respiraculi]
MPPSSSANNGARRARPTVKKADKDAAKRAAANASPHLSSASSRRERSRTSNAERGTAGNPKRLAVPKRMRARPGEEPATAPRRRQSAKSPLPVATAPMRKERVAGGRVRIDARGSQPSAPDRRTRAGRNSHRSAIGANAQVRTYGKGIGTPQTIGPSPRYTPIGTTYSNRKGTSFPQRILDYVKGFFEACYRHAPRATIGVAAGILIVLCANIAYGIDGINSADKIMPGVSVSGVDVSGMTQEEAVTAVSSKYEPLLGKDAVHIYASDDYRLAQAKNTGTTDQASVAENSSNTVVWDATSDSLQATIDYYGLARSAYDQGRGGVLDRLFLNFGGRNLDVGVELNGEAVNNLALQIDATLGEASQEFGISIDGGAAQVTEGHDGNMVDRVWLTDQISRMLLQESDDPRGFTAVVQYTPVRIDRKAAQATADAVNAALAHGAVLSCNGQTLSISGEDLGSLVGTTVAPIGNGSYRLDPYLDEEGVKKTVLKFVTSTTEEAPNASVGFYKADDGTIMVRPANIGLMPQSSEAASNLDRQLFDSYRNTGKAADFSEAPTVEVSMTEAPSTMTFDDAVSYGVVTVIQSFTTEYTANREARNTNIHLAADLLNNSIVPADGGVWSFNDIAGECNAEKGFMAAGSVVGGQHTDEIGGGICQVATTVFNAVFLAGYPVKERHNHSIYISAYPAGRDAAISWTSPDLKWTNDTPSDVLVRMDYDDTTVTCTLYGIDPDYKVEYQTGDWEEGEDFKTVYETDDSLATGVQVLAQNGTKGRHITVTRTVKDAARTVRGEDTFTSNYVAQNRIIKVGA